MGTKIFYGFKIKTLSKELVNFAKEENVFNPDIDGNDIIEKFTKFKCTIEMYSDFVGDFKEEKFKHYVSSKCLYIDDYSPCKKFTLPKIVYEFENLIKFTRYFKLKMSPNKDIGWHYVSD